MAFTANAAIMPRNKIIVGTPRRHQTVKSTSLTNPSITILLAEWHEERNWGSLYGSDSSGGSQEGGGTGAIEGKIKSHRSVMPFVGKSSGANVLAEPLGSGQIARFGYPAPSDVDPQFRGIGAIESANSTLNAVGLHHQGRGNFAYADGHVDHQSLDETIRRRLWGDYVWSVTGFNAVDTEHNPWPVDD
jgi:prepilin-type processing-associated H-X9-DG protein